MPTTSRNSQAKKLQVPAGGSLAGMNRTNGGKETSVTSAARGEGLPGKDQRKCSRKRYAHRGRNMNGGVVKSMMVSGPESDKQGFES